MACAVTKLGHLATTTHIGDVAVLDTHGVPRRNVVVGVVPGNNPALDEVPRRVSFE